MSSAGSLNARQVLATAGRSEAALSLLGSRQWPNIFRRISCIWRTWCIVIHQSNEISSSKECMWMFCWKRCSPQCARTNPNRSRDGRSNWRKTVSKTVRVAVKVISPKPNCATVTRLSSWQYLAMLAGTGSLQCRTLKIDNSTIDNNKIVITHSQNKRMVF